MPAAAPVTVAIDIPAHLTPDAARWYQDVSSTWQLDSHHLRLLQMAAEAWDLAQKAREQVARDGLTVPTGAGGIKAHPCVSVTRAARQQFAALVALLDLDDDQAPPGPDW